MPDGPATVLVVDDTPTKLYILSSWLRRSGHEVLQATGGVEALGKVRDLRPDLVVLDVRLPDMSGYEVCERIKADKATSSIPVIQISGAAITPADRTQGLERGADAYLAERSSRTSSPPRSRRRCATTAPGSGPSGWRTGWRPSPRSPWR